jgi:hypothetical protein
MEWPCTPQVCQSCGWLRDTCTEAMKGRDHFTRQQAKRIRELLDARGHAERAEQKQLRDQLRGIGFYISDWGGPGLDRADFDQLIAHGAITLTYGGLVDQQQRSVSAARKSPIAASASPAAPHDTARIAVTDAGRALRAPGHRVAEAAAHVPNAAGLYAVHGDGGVWRELGLGEPPDDRPLYVGKAERSLASRDLRTHFDTGRTGSSTVRRSFAALLRDTLALRAEPRNTSKPERPANYGLDDEGDARLTEWMQARLTLAVWPKHAGVVLVDVERALLSAWQPPLNLKDVETRWSSQLCAARRAMANDARVWARDRGYQL